MMAGSNDTRWCILVFREETNANVDIFAVFVRERANMMIRSHLFSEGTRGNHNHTGRTDPEHHSGPLSPLQGYCCHFLGLSERGAKA